MWVTRRKAEGAEESIANYLAGFTHRQHLTGAAKHEERADRELKVCLREPWYLLDGIVGLRG